MARFRNTTLNSRRSTLSNSQVPGLVTNRLKISWRNSTDKDFKHLDNVWLQFAYV